MRVDTTNIQHAGPQPPAVTPSGVNGSAVGRTAGPQTSFDSQQFSGHSGTRGAGGEGENAHAGGAGAHAERAVVRTTQMGFRIGGFGLTYEAQDVTLSSDDLRRQADEAQRRQAGRDAREFQHHLYDAEMRIRRTAAQHTSARSSSSNSGSNMGPVPEGTPLAEYLTMRRGHMAYTHAQFAPQTPPPRLLASV